MQSKKLNKCLTFQILMKIKIKSKCLSIKPDKNNRIIVDLSIFLKSLSLNKIIINLVLKKSQR